MNQSEPVRSKAIGVFDSGLGGLTVVHEIRQCMPNENIVFLGDIARVPYGLRSPETVMNYAVNCSTRLNQYDIKVLVVACNTVSAVALNHLKELFAMPVIGVIEPGASAGVQVKSSAHIGVIATRGTIASGAYESAIKAIDPSAKVSTNPAPLLVPLVEEGWIDSEVTQLTINHYLTPLVKKNIDILILGCTHYPLLKKTIIAQLKKQNGAMITVVDSAIATSRLLEKELLVRNLRQESEQPGWLKILVTDLPSQFSEVASSFLGEKVPTERISIESIDI